MESFCKYKDRVFSVIDEELKALDHAVGEEFILRENAFAAEKKAFQEEIHTLRQESSRIKELENENRSLRSELSARLIDSKGPVGTRGRKLDDPRHGYQGADEIKLAGAQDCLEELRNSYGRLVGAHLLLKKKYKLAQQTNRKWDIYYQKVNQRSIDEAPAGSADIVELKNTFNPTDGQQTTPSLLAIPSPRSLSSASGSISPSTEVLLDTRAISQRRDPVSSPRLPVKTSPRKEALDMHDVFDIPPDPEPYSVAETCDESQNESDIEHSLVGRQDDPVNENIKQPAEPVDDGSDHPVIVAERSLKRKRDSSFKKRNREAHDEHTHYCSKEKPVRVKNELGSSSPMAPVSFPRILDPQDSIDLDEVGEKHFTPRKHRRLLNERQLQAAGLGPPVAAGIDEILVEHGASDQNPKNPQDQNLDSEKDEETDQCFDGDVGNEDEENDQSIPCDKAFFIRQGQEYGARLWAELQRNNAGRSKTAKSIPPKALKTADPNIQLRPRSSGRLIDRKRALPSNRRISSSALISILTEDGEEFSTVNDRNSSHALRAATKAKQASTRKDPHKTPRAADFDQRLGPLLAKPSTQKASLVLCSPVIELEKSTKEFSTPLDASVLRNDGKSLVTPISNRGHVAEKTAGGTKASKPIRSSLRSRAEAKPVSPILTRMHEPREVLPKYTSLRARPLASLRPTDFKLNPARNQGLDHPFSEVVRNRDLRKCMPGCKRPGCCGTKLRKAVEIGGYIAPRKSGLSNPSPEKDVEEDERLLEEYLGDNKSHLQGMLAEERQELLLQAKTEQFANLYGKHRYVYGRPQSPPGYWDTDMPSTPRQKEYQAAAMAHEIEKTADMYKEAMRPNGLYKFRDE